MIQGHSGVEFHQQSLVDGPHERHREKSMAVSFSKASLSLTLELVSIQRAMVKGRLICWAKCGDVLPDAILIDFEVLLGQIGDKLA